MALEKLDACIRKDDYMGWDVFDGLNSRLFQSIPFSKSRVLRLAWIQFFKKSPVNFRAIAGVPKGHNPKALALFISGYVNLYQVSGKKQYLIEAERLSEYLDKLKSTDYCGTGWGYNFDWQARAFFVPKFKPNMVCSVFAGHAYLDLFIATRKDIYLETARAVADFIIGTLILKETKENLCFAYIPGESAVVHNANLLGAAYLARLYSILEEDKFCVYSKRSISFSVKAQNDDGSWVYGERKHHQWVDNFHTGYNLTSIYNYQRYCNDTSFESNLIKGLEYHIHEHFTSGYLPKYTNIDLYPLDIHCFSQGIISTVVLEKYWKDVEIFRSSLLENLFEIMYNSKSGCFYYQKFKYMTNKIPYIRWSQAWMYYSLTLLLLNKSDGRN